MLFNSFSFLAFFAILVAIYYALPPKFRWLLLLAASIYFYSTFNAGYVLLLLASALLAYVAGLGIGAAQEPGRKKLVAIAGVLASLAPLFVFKYFDFFAGSLNELMQSSVAPALGLLLPAGLSFFSFSCVSYILDVYQNRLAAERHVGRFTLYVSFFPKLLAGPIERATTFLPQVLRPVRFDPEGVTAGLQLMLWGLFKKVVIADRLAVFVDTAYKNPELGSPLALVIATYFFAFQIYCDFSGYSDIAIGAARVLGFNLMENFRRPYMATSAPEFWGKNRWHISLSNWFRDYMYIPMGGSKVGKPRFYLNQVAVFLVSGLWHGANWTFVVWGGLNGLYQIVTVMTAGIREKLGRILRVPGVVGSLVGSLVTFHLVTLAWVFFRASSISDATTILARIAAAVPRLPTLVASYPFTDEIVLSIILIGVLLVVEIVDEKRALWERLGTRPVYVRWAVYYALIFALVILGKWGLKQFVYMQF
ncbi:MAG: MBOAT family protein [Chloroflexi bacterium]|nr:MBOAT family protein [Chloroflexota bacterium]